MSQPASKRFGRFEYDAATGRWLVAVSVLAAAALGILAFNNLGSPRMDDKRQIEQGVTIPNPTQLSPAQTRPQ